MKKTAKKAGGSRKTMASRSGWSHWIPRLPWSSDTPSGKGLPLEEDMPLRAELFGVSQLSDYAKVLAEKYAVERIRGKERLLHRLSESVRGIHRCHQTIAESVRQGSRIAPAAEWLLDNYHLIQEQIELARAHLSPGYSRELPRLKSGRRKGFPRIYGIVRELVRHTDGQVDAENLGHFVKAYQEVTPLTLGELWAAPIMLRLTLIENLHFVSRQIAWRRSQRDAALVWAERFLKVVETNPREFVTELGDFVRAAPTLTAPFIAELIANIDGVNPTLGLALNWIEQELSGSGQTIELIQQSENEAQAANQVTTSNSITSIRALAAIDWADFVESLSATEAVLHRDPAGVHADMDFRTRNQYRTQIEKLSRWCSYSEEEVAETVVSLAVEKHHADAERRESHVGFFLIDAGRQTLEAKLECRVPLRLRMGRNLRRHPLALYLFSIAAISALLATLPLSALPGGHLGLIGGLLLAAAGFAVTKPALTLLNWILTLVVPPRSIPSLDFSKGIPPEHQTIVVVPTLLVPPASMAPILDDLEIRFLANKSAHLHFALLTDFPDADAETLPKDSAWLEAAIQGIRRLNSTHAQKDDPLFFLLHRPRKWNPEEGKWMGQERKRGKLEDFNRLVMEGGSEAFSVIEGDPRLLRTVRYVITLDTDTQLPPSSASRMAGAMAHLLNRPKLDPATQFVTCGYGILQPRLAVSLTSARQSIFSRLFAGEVGMDPYTREVANVYQDVFGQGQFVGKGIYDVQAFHVATGNRFPENRILSHDLIEGCYARCGFLSDVELVETEPSRYLADVNRRHRWTRGDWQIASWLFPRVPGPDGKATANPLSGLARWMIFDNLRRSLLPLALFLSLTGIWFVQPAAAAGWTLGLFAAFFLPAVLRTARSFAFKGSAVPLPIHLRHTATAESRQWIIDLLDLAFVPYHAVMYLDAIVRVFWRLAVRRRLLEWKTASHSERTARTSLLGVVLEMWTAPAIALACGAGLHLIGTASLIPVVLFGIWAASPAAAWFVSRTLEAPRTPLNASQILFLRKLARRTWAYFETHVGPQHNWLPPDNVQEKPVLRIATRTSPTNVGMALGSGLAAVDFGYLTAGRFLARTEKTLDVLEGLERYRGHFYNWYDTQTLHPLHPLYISTVDSGNFSGMLIVVREGLSEMLRAPILPLRWKDGLEDAIGILQQEIEEARHRSDCVIPIDVLKKAAAKLQETQKALRPSLSGPANALQLAESLLADLSQMTPALASDESLSFWRASLERQGTDLANEIRHFAPWTEAECPLPDASTHPDAGPLWDELRKETERIPTLEAAATLHHRWEARLAQAAETDRASQWIQWLQNASEYASKRIETLRKVAAQCTELSEMDLEFLYDKDRNLLSIGFNLDNHKIDPGYYDLLASECRLVSYVGVAQGHLPLEHWFHLGRRLAPGGGSPVLASWSGSMFEYLMPLLVMPTYEGTLLQETYTGSVRRQIQYAHQVGIPWGISESGYNQVDTHHIYQYRAFGVPILGMKRGLADDLVMAPYASIMALMVTPKEAFRNLRLLATQGTVGRLGFYEAVDYTPARVPSGEAFALVRSWMAHHSGMSLLAMDFLLNDQPMQRRFMADPQLKSAHLLLQERIPLARPRIRATAAVAETAGSRQDVAFESVTRAFTTADTPAPEIHLLSNGRYHVMVNNSGSGFSRWQNLALTRWREDSAQDERGLFFLLREVDSGKTWSATPQPLHPAFDRYEAIYSQGSAEFQSEIHQFQASTHVAVCPEDDMELRQMTLTNLSRRARTVEITSYTEVVLIDGKTEATHPAFHKLFVQTEPLPGKAALLFTRRPRSSEETHPWMFHTLLVEGGTLVRDASFETDREAFIGRGRSIHNPAALDEPGPLPNRTGLVLDPSAAIRYRVRIEAGRSICVNAFLGVAPTREEAETYVDRCRDPHMAERVFSLAWTRSQVLLHQLRANEADVQHYARLASSILYAGPHRRARASIIARNRKNQSALWSYGISGDRPIVVLSIADLANLELVRNMVQAHTYWRQKGIEVDLVIWSEAYAGYRQDLLNAIVGLVQAGTEAKMLDQPGGIFVRNIDQIPEDDRDLFLSVARIVLSDRYGTLAEQIDRRVMPELDIPDLVPTRSPEKPDAIRDQLPFRELEFFNGFGGFTHDGREYVVQLSAGEATPAPWVNVLANPRIGSVISESGSAYTWSENAQLFRLTPWHNDAVTDTCGEAFYIRDEETGHFWSPSPKPATGDQPYVCRHGHGYSVFEHSEDGLFSEMTAYVAKEAPLKFSAITLKNLTDRPRRVTLTGYCEWVLGDRRQQNAPHVVTRLDPQSGALFAENTFNPDFADRVALFHCSSPNRSLTGDRTEFIGRNGSLKAPAAMRRGYLSNRVGAGLDPCAAIMSFFDIPPGEQIQVVFALGSAASVEEARGLIRQQGGVGGARQALEEVWHFWQRQLGGLYVETPDKSVNFLVNHWLLYQILASRFWGRSGFYQSGGAVGFRDQLQDSLAFLYECPWLARQHLLTSAAHQFPAGDVQHWWHPPTDRGVRTHISDDLLWLPYVLCRYLETTGDTGILDEQIPFIEARELTAEEESVYDQPRTSDERASLYEHAARAIRHSLKTGTHGLPLMGSGDWNDGMNRVGHKGRGESVWLGFFLYRVLQDFAKLAQSRDDSDFAAECTQAAETLSSHLDTHAWDGKWYLRAFFDDGTPLGSAQSPECQIDSLPQSWSILSGACDPARAKIAMQSAQEHLVEPDMQLIRLFEPPFDTAPWDPGYIKGYVPGVRENGGQYTHAAVWVAMAVAAMKQPDKAWELFQLLNPVHHGDTPARAARYKIEPYVLAADIYTAKGHEGEGGWSWYTGSAAWLYQLLVGNLLGIHLETNVLTFTPLFPKDWTEFKVTYRFWNTFYHIQIKKVGEEPGTIRHVWVDDEEQLDQKIHLVDDGQERQAYVEVG
jgi:cyclic beta-1,2-glucan glucanotransferase